MIRFLGFAAAVRIAVVIAAFGTTAAIAHSSDPSAWTRGLQSSASPAQQRHPAAKPTPDWLVALQTRSEALDHLYGLGDARSSQAVSAAPWYVALMARSDALDRRYHLGRYADAP